MKKLAFFLFIPMACTSLPACSPMDDEPVPPPIQEEQTGNDSTDVSDDEATNPEDSIPETPTSNDSIPSVNPPEDNDNEEGEIMESNKIKLFDGQIKLLSDGFVLSNQYFVVYAQNHQHIVDNSFKIKEVPSV